MNLKILKLPGSKKRLRKSELTEESAKPYLKTNQLTETITKQKVKNEESGPERQLSE